MIEKSQLQHLVEVMDRLRSSGGCPWDAQQTHESLLTYLIEESYEFIDAVERSDRADMLEELGDILLQVVFHARIASEEGGLGFDIEDVAKGISNKLISRHPHVFSEEKEFKNALKKLVNNESLVKIEHAIEERRKRLLTSRGWARASGVK
jgi:XTP/dITP diphosphohydrolase